MKTGTSGPMRVEVVDSYHRDWPRALKLIDRLGQRERLGIGPDGWLPARRTLVVAFEADEPVGHLCFSVTPVVERTASTRRMRLEARVEGRGIAGGRDALAGELERAARDLAASLNCEIFRLDERGGERRGR